MINKLDPRQYNPYALNTPSGNLSFEEGVDFFNCNLLENLTGDFNIFGSLEVNSGKVVFSDVSNLIEDNNNSVINSTNSSVSGSNNTLINSNQSVLLGNNNTIIGGQQNDIRDSDYSAILFGSNVINQNTGSVIIADGNLSRQKESVRDDALTIDFSSGTFILNDLFVDGSVYLTGNLENDGNLTVKQGSTAIFEGDINISGTAFHSGSPLQNLENLTGASGHLLSLTTGLSGIMNSTFEATGDLLLSDIEATGVRARVMAENVGEVNAAYTNFISGELTDQFNGNFVSAKTLVIESGRFIPSNFDSTGISGQLSFDQQYFYVCTGDGSGWARIGFDSTWAGGLS
tara:strand:+ start:447 stop:1481 length:1035 start_codon:yes stop_codon:yes gene_type:complete